MTKTAAEWIAFRTGDRDTYDPSEHAVASINLVAEHWDYILDRADNRVQQIPTQYARKIGLTTPPDVLGFSWQADVAIKFVKGAI